MKEYINHEMKRYHRIVTDIWRIFRKYGDRLPVADDDTQFWSDFITDVENIERKYQRNHLAVGMCVDVMEAISTLNKSLYEIGLVEKGGAA